MKNNYTYTGERLTFLELFSEKKWKVEVPIIQRDYAQGRESTKDIRDAFLSTLFKHLKKSSNIDLDFVYGSISKADDTLFIPLDGQQRLTTLFLLHWYLANKQNMKQDFIKHFVNKGKSKFTYETRTSSREFCDALVNSDIDFTSLLMPVDNKEYTLSYKIRDSAWYFSSWDNDPTIKAMLLMLDAIHIKFKNTDGFWNKLITTKNPIITFQFLNLEDFGLSDDLYIKMNARGKLLTTFENFKAKFEQFIKEININNPSSYSLTIGEVYRKVSLHDYFSHKIDTDWSNLFWNYRDEKKNLYDNKFMNFIRVLAANHYALKASESKSRNRLKILIDSYQDISFQKYQTIDCFDEEYIIQLISILDLLSNGDKKIKMYLSKDNMYYDEEKIFKAVINNELTYTQRIQFYAFYQYLIVNENFEGLEDWIRVISNLSENTTYDRQFDYERSLKAVKSLLPNSETILQYLSSSDNKIEGFLGLQITEERIKAILFQKSEEWKNTILDIEKHGYFKGQIGFILNFSGIELYFKNNKNCQWSSKEDKKFFESFNNYSRKAKAIFNFYGLKEFPDYIWERALLKKGDYLLLKGSNNSFLINNDRDISWKRLLRDSSTERDVVKDLFDDECFDLRKTEESLNTIIYKEMVADWRKHFIEIPDIINYLGLRKFIRWHGEHKIYLLRKERMSGSHAEYYSYAFYIKHLKNKHAKLFPFKRVNYYSPSGTEEAPCAFIDKWKYKNAKYAINISYLFDKDKYEIRFFNRNDKIIHDEVIEILKNNSFVQYSKYYDESYFVECKDKDILSNLIQLCKELSKCEHKRLRK